MTATRPQAPREYRARAVIFLSLCLTIENMCSLGDQGPQHLSCPAVFFNLAMTVFPCLMSRRISGFLLVGIIGDLTAALLVKI